MPENFLKRARDIEKNVKTEVRQKAKSKQPAEHDESNWLVSYADMMTLLCAFFIMLLSMSKMNPPDFERVKRELATQFGGKYISPTVKTAEFYTQLIEELGVEKKTVISSDPNGVALIFESSLMFESNSSLIRSEGLSVIDKLTDTMLDKEALFAKRYKYIIEGHTDTRPILSGKWPSNWELSSARAASVARILMEKGVDPKQITVIGYGGTRPRHQERDGADWNQEAQIKNRRVAIRILEPTIDSIPWEHYTTGEIEKAESSYKAAKEVIKGI